MNSELNPPRLATEPSDESGRERRAKRVSEYYDRVAPNRDKWISRNSYFHDEDSRFARFLVPEGLKVLDLGCGTGMVAQNFRDVAEEMHGVDLSPKMIEGARQKEVFDALYVEDVIEFLEHPERGSFKYDLIIAAELFVYIGSLKTIFAAVAKVMATGGMFVFSVETLEKGDYKLLATGRYSQSAAYIEKLASANDFSIELRDPVVLRNAKPSPIAGNLFILRAAVQ